MSKITKRALAESLKSVLKTKDISKIKIKDITDNIELNRQTFYYHFKDIYDLIEWIYMNDIIEEIKIFDTYDKWQSAYLFIFNYILKNRDFISNTYNLSTKTYLSNFIYEQTNMMILNIVNEKSENINEEDKMFICKFYSYAFVGLLSDWIDNGMRDNPQDIINNLSKILEDNFVQTLEKYN